MLGFFKKRDSRPKRKLDTFMPLMFNDGKSAWLHHKKHLLRKTGVNVLAKLWIRSKRLRALKELYLKKTLSPTAKIYKRDVPKGQIRLLQIKPGYDLSTIQCAFSYLDLQENGDYVALSYTWGDAIPSIPILINGAVTMVTENLYLALLHLRKGKITKVWVDALCINQQNSVERSIQVSQMAQVYQGASMVFIWLGESNELTKRAFAEFYELTQHFEWNNKISAAHFNTDVAHPKWRAMGELLYRPWFRRVWIIQEILHARHALFVCGGDFLEATTFLTIISGMIEAGALMTIIASPSNDRKLENAAIRTATKQLEFMVQTQDRSVNPFLSRDFRGNLLDYLSQTRWAEATDPRDKIYGILSLAKDASALGWYEEDKQRQGIKPHQRGYHRSRRVLFTVDYNVPPAQVFINVTKAIISTTRSIEILKFVETGAPRLNKLPSWVPNWGETSPAPTIHTPFNYERQSHDSFRPVVWRPQKHWDFGNATTDRIRMMISNNITEYCSAELSFGPEDTLKIKGVEYDQITALSTHSHPPDRDLIGESDLEWLCALRDYWVRLTQWLEECMQLFICHKPHPTLKETLTLFKKLLYRENVRNDNIPDPECFEDILTALGKAIDALEVEIRVQQLQDDEPLLPILRTAAIVRHEGSHFSQLPSPAIFRFSPRLCVTANKRIGLVPADAEVGDAVCIMYGSEHPFILRRCGRQKFRFLGHGILEGFDFDAAVVEKTYRLRDWDEPCRKDSIKTCVTAKRFMCTVLKKTTMFCLV